MKIGIVVEGGGMRGIYASGVIDALLENHIEADGLIGVSAGATHGCNYISKQKGRSIRYYSKYMNDPDFMSFKSLITTGDYVNEAFCYQKIPDQLDLFDYQAFQASKTNFYVVATNVETGKAEYIKITSLPKQIDYIRASASLPFFSKIVEIDGLKLLDGGVADSIPVEKMIEMGYDKIIVILTRERGYVKKAEYNTLPNIIYHDYPDFYQALLNRHIIYNATLDKIEELSIKKKIFVIQPSKKLNVPRLTDDFSLVKEAYLEGYQDMNEKMEKLKRYLEI